MAERKKPRFEGHAPLVGRENGRAEERDTPKSKSRGGDDREAGASASSSKTELSLSVLSSADQLALLQSDWERLLNEAGISSPFMTWEWLYPWYKAHQDEGQVLCMTVADGQRLVGLAPLFASQRADPFLRRGEIGFASTFGHSWGFYLEFVAAPGYAELVMDLIWRHLLEERSDWSRLRFGRMPLRMSLLPELLRCSASSGFPCVTKRGLRIMRGVLPDQVGELGSWIPSRNRRRKTRRMCRHLEDAVGPIELRSYGNGDGQEFDRLLHALAQMNLRQRQHFGQRSNFEDPRFAHCFSESSRLLAAREWLELNALFAGEHLVAVSVDLLYKGTLYAMQPAYDPAFARYDAGHILMAMVVDEAIRKGVRQLDMLPGGAYKQQYVPCDEPMMQAVVPGPTVSGAMPVGVELLRQAVGRAYRRALGNKEGGEDPSHASDQTSL